MGAFTAFFEIMFVMFKFQGYRKQNWRENISVLDVNEYYGPVSFFQGQIETANTKSLFFT